MNVISFFDIFCNAVSMTIVNNLKVKRDKSNMKHKKSKTPKKRAMVKGRSTERVTTWVTS